MATGSIDTGVAAALQAELSGGQYDYSMNATCAAQKVGVYSMELGGRDVHRILVTLKAPRKKIKIQLSKRYCNYIKIGSNQQCTHNFCGGSGNGNGGCPLN